MISVRLCLWDLVSSGYLLTRCDQRDSVNMWSRIARTRSVRKSSSQWHGYICKNKLWRPLRGISRWFFRKHHRAYWHDGRQYTQGNQIFTLVIHKTIQSPTLVQSESNQIFSRVESAPGQNLAIVWSTARSQTDSEICSVKSRPHFDIRTVNSQSDFDTCRARTYVSTARYQVAVVSAYMTFE